MPASRRARPTGRDPVTLKASAQFIWETGSKVCVEYSFGTGAHARAGLVMGVKTIGICHNAAHCRVAKQITLTWLVDLMQSESCPPHIKPADIAKKLEELKHPRLKLHESARGTEQALKKPTDLQKACEEKRSAVADAFEAAMGDPSAKKPRLAQPRLAPPAAAGAAGTPAGTEAAAGTPAAPAAGAPAAPAAGAPAAPAAGTGAPAIAKAAAADPAGPKESVADMMKLFAKSVGNN